MQKILVGVDLSPESEHAIAHAITLARREGAKVVLAMVDCVPEFPANLAASSQEIALSYTKALEQRLADDRRRLGVLHERWSKSSWMGLRTSNFQKSRRRLALIWSWLGAAVAPDCGAGC
jgi:nucleotide-binding universal stress UspA family protein